MKLHLLTFCLCIASLALSAGCSGNDDDKKCTDCSGADSGGVSNSTTADMGGGGDEGTTPGCADGTLNGDESDVDCGGSCASCAAGQQCAAAADCESGACDGTCQEASCEDGVMNRDEADVDCGGEHCLRCEEGSPCLNQCDCQSGSCVDGTCRHSLVGSWSGSPEGTAGVRITMDFEDERVEWFQSFNNGQMDCFHQGAGAVSNLTDESFDMTGYAKIDNSCNLGMFLRGDYAVGFEFTNSERSAVRVAPAGSEAYRLRRVVEEELECAQPAGPPPTPGEGGFGNLDPYPTYELLFDAFFDGIDPVNAAGFLVAMAGEPTVYDCPTGGTVTVTHTIRSPVEGITYDTVDALFEDCGVALALEAGEQALTVSGTVAHEITNRGIGPEYDVQASLTATGALSFGVECNLRDSNGSCSFADEIGNVIEGGGAVRSATRFPRYLP